MDKIIIAGGTGFLGQILTRHFIAKGKQVVILTRGRSQTRGEVRYEQWDGKGGGEWTKSLEGAEAIINLNGRSVDCRYTRSNRELIYSTRLESTHAIGDALSRCHRPPKVWINASSATIYRHSVDKEMDETHGEIGTGFSVDVCQKWEGLVNSFHLNDTRKVILRIGIVLGRSGGPLQAWKNLALCGAGGKQGEGNQYVSWLHEDDFVSIVDYVLHNDRLSGVFNATAPEPVLNEELMRSIRRKLGVPFGIDLPRWLLEIGAAVIRTETELVLKSRRVVPRRLSEEGYHFLFSSLREAIPDLCG